MKHAAALTAAFAMAVAGQALAQSTTAAASKPFVAGQALSVTVDGAVTPLSSNVKVYGSVVSAESCSFDETRKLIVVPNRGAAQTEVPNDGFVTLMKSDGTVHTTRWIGLNRDGGLVLNQPFGSDIQNGKLYLADSDGGTADGAKRISVVRMFDMKTGAPAGEVKVPDSPWFNDIEVAKDGTIYASQTGSADVPMKVWKVTADGKASVFLEGPILKSPNGIGIDNDGNVVVVNMGSDEVLTFSPDAKLLKTEHAAMPGNDGIVIMPDGTKYLSSVQRGGVSRMRPGRPAELIATGIPNAASMCYDSAAKQLVIPMNANNALAFIKLD